MGGVFTEKIRTLYQLVIEKIAFPPKPDIRKYGQTDGPTDRQTDGQTDGHE